MSSLSSFKNPAAYHLLSYGTLLGSNLFNSFIGGIVAFNVLPRPQFSTLMKHTFPPYFTLQTACPLLMIATYPSGTSRLLPAWLGGTGAAIAGHASAWATRADRLSFWLIGTMLSTALVNLVYVGPQTTEVMKLRKHQETRDGKKSYDKGPHSDEMQRLNRQFGILHGVSSAANLVGFLGMCWYGIVLGEGFRW